MEPYIEDVPGWNGLRDVMPGDGPQFDENGKLKDFHIGPQKERVAPILLDLDGNGVKIDDLSRSTVFVDAGGDGLKHRTAWAGAGDGVLFFDADNDGAISQKREYCSPNWDPTPIPTWRR